MKLFLPALFIFNIAYGQVCSKQVIIYGSKANGLFSASEIVSYSNVNSNPDQAEIVSAAWTCNGLGFPTCNFRTVFKYNVSAIPQNAIVSSAKLYLYAKPNANNGNHVDPTFGSANTSLLQKVVEPWQPGVPAWTTQPSTDTTNQKTLPQSSSNSQNYVVDVSDFVQSWVSDSAANYGVMIRLNNEQYYNSMIFYSGQADSSKQPRLEIVYTLPNDANYVVHGSKANGLFSASEIVSYSNVNSNPDQAEIVSAAWTCNGLGFPTCNFRTVFKYNVSAIPQNAIVSSAKLYLYAKPNANNGNHVDPTYGSANTSLLQKVVEPWQPGVPAWTTQPATDTTNQKTLPQSSSNFQNYVVDVSDFVQSWVSDSAANYGVMIRLKNEQYYNSMIFYSGQAADSLQPRLDICYSIRTILPLQLTTFAGSSSDSKNTLTWTIENGMNTNEIELERSTDGTRYSRITSFKYAGGSANMYGYEDYNLANLKKFFYRLKFISKDGSSTYSKVITLNREKSFRFEIFPNPAESYIQLIFTSEKAQTGTIKIVTPEGNLIYLQKMNFKNGVNSVVIDNLKRFAKGTYFLLTEADQKISTKRFILQ